MVIDRAAQVHTQFLNRLSAGNFPKRASKLSAEDAGLSHAELAQIFISQMTSRQLDRAARDLQKQGEGFYTIGSSGHEGNAAVAAALRPTDMAFLHYRDAAFQIHRATQVAGETPLWDMMLSFTASADDPISGGRHKVLGSKRLNIPPQTSTIASHLPKAVGTAFGIGLSRHVPPEFETMPDDGLVVCSFGDASANHSTSQGAFNTAAWTAYQGIALPLMFICEDNGIGISTRTPENWIAASFRNRDGLKYFACNGLDIIETYKTIYEAAAYIRKYKRPVFVHMKCVRLYGHAGSDVQTAYMGKRELEHAEADDPLLHGAGLTIAEGAMTAQSIRDTYDQLEQRIARIGKEVIKRPKLMTPDAVMRSIVPPKRDITATSPPSKADRMALFGSDLKAMEKPQPMAKLLNWALADLMSEHESIVMAGEDIGPKGGVYHVTAKLFQRFGAKRVINTLLDEQSILGLAIGLAQTGFLPIPEIQFLAYLHNAEDQIRGEAATLCFFSKGQFTNPMIIRIAGLAYQRGFGGHFHNDNSIAVLRDIPGVIIACPSNGRDAVQMMRECVRLAREEQRVIVFLEPIALYNMRDLYEPDDKGWASIYEPPGHGDAIGFGDIGQFGKGTDLAILTYGNGNYLSHQAQAVLSKTHKMKTRVIDLRWLAPLNEEAILRAIKPCSNVLIVDECRKTGSHSEALMALVQEGAKHQPKLARLTADDSFIPLGKGATVTLPSKDSIIEAALNLVGEAAK